ncbi:MAG TPA: methyltransferase domain-containing protein, partial [bacterium]|nr:methyltransferase domain-containing protein [bacterium]
MKPDLAPLLRCLDCGKSDWDIKVDSENSFEVREGSLICRECRAHYPVHDGILGMLRELSEEVAHEKKHAESFSYLETREGEKFPINRETLNRFRQLFLSLPAGDGSEIFQPGGSFDNQAGNARRFFKTLEMLRLTGSERVLEVGASFGWSAWRFAQKGCDVVALDVTDYLMAGDLYMEADGSFFNRMTADMNGLPFRDGTFDLIFAHSVLHHCKDVGELFRELRRVLR